LKDLSLVAGWEKENSSRKTKLQNRRNIIDLDQAQAMCPDGNNPEYS
jgi:hypothetical protein